MTVSNSEQSDNLYDEKQIVPNVKCFVHGDGTDETRNQLLVTDCSNQHSGVEKRLRLAIEINKDTNPFTSQGSSTSCSSKDCMPSKKGETSFTGGIRQDKTAQVLRKSDSTGYMSSKAWYSSSRTLAPVKTSFPETKINKTTFGFIMRYIRPGKSSGS